MKRLLLVLALAACAPEPETSIRDASVTVASSTRFDASQFAGEWVVRLRDPSSHSLVSLKVQSQGTEVELEERHVACDGFGACVALGDIGRGQVTGPGRLSLTYNGGTTREIWVLWVDPDYRTAALGDPQGTFAWVVDRKANGGADRIKAALEVLDFNGFDTALITEGGS